METNRGVVCMPVYSAQPLLETGIMARPSFQMFLLKIS